MLAGITNFLEEGALLRHEGQWILIEGPFSPISSPQIDEITLCCPDFYEVTGAQRFVGTRSHVLPNEEFEKLILDYLRGFEGCRNEFEGLAWQEPSLGAFEKSLNLIKNHIHAGHLDKAVPAVFSKVSKPVSAHTLALMLRALLSAPPSLYIYGFWQEGEGILGATPELLFQLESNEIQTMALAGTCPKIEAAERISLLSDKKERSEHHLVVRDLKAILGQWGDVKIDGPRILELPTLFHLKTDLCVRVSEKPNALDLMKKLHPTPALGVAPRKAGYQWMKNLPGQENRKRFGAPFLFEKGEWALCLVAIRNLQWNNKESMIGSGCGIVAASECGREWRELSQKRTSVMKVLGLDV